MRLCNETVTLFNARLEEETGYDVYYPTVIAGVSWYCEMASTVDSSGLKAANKFTVRIPLDADFNGKTYLPPHEYAVCEDPTQYFTLQEGAFLVRGTVTEEIKKPADLHTNYDEVTTILSVTDNRRAYHAKHWKVVGK